MTTRLLAFGATGATGRHLVAQAADGWSVHASGRDPARLAALGGELAWSVADARDAAAVADTISSVRPDAIVSLIGGDSLDDVGNIAVAEAARRAGVRRLVLVTSLGCGESRAFASERLLAAIGPVLAAKTRAEDHLRGLDLDWTIVRPGGLTEGGRTGNGSLYDDPRVHGRIARADLAALLWACLHDPRTIRRILSAVDRSTLSGPPDVQELPLSLTDIHSLD